MPRYLIRFDDGRTSEAFDAVGDREAAEYALECLLDDGAEPGEEAAVYRLSDDGRGCEDHIATVEVPE